MHLVKEKLGELGPGLCLLELEDSGLEQLLQRGHYLALAELAHKVTHELLVLGDGLADGLFLADLGEAALEHGLGRVVNLSALQLRERHDCHDIR